MELDESLPRLTRRRLVLHLIGIVVLVAAAIVLALTVGLPDPAGVRANVAEVGPLGPIVYAVFYGFACLSPLPKTVFTLLAGAVFGIAVGLPVVMAGAMLGALMAFYLGRLLGKETVHRLFGRRLVAFDTLIERRGLLAVLLARLIPIVPFTAVNYMAGVTALRLRDLMLGTLIGIIPATTAYIAIGSYGGEPGSWPFIAAIGALLVLSAGGLWAAHTHRRRTNRTRTNKVPFE